MFCDKCGAPLADTASFCNKCGNTVKKRVGQAEANYSTPKMSTATKSIKKKKNALLGVIIAFLLLVVIAVGAVVAFFAMKSKPTIYGSWADSTRTITFSFNENGELRVSGPYNILGAELFTFTEDNGKIRLNANDEIAGIISLEMDYELKDNSMTVSVLGHTMTLYRVEESDTSGNMIEDIVEDVMDEVQIASVYGTWTDVTGTVSFTFYEDGKLRISGLGDTLGVDVFAFSEVDADTLQLNADTDNVLLGMVSVHLDYEISGDTMTVSIADMHYTLVKQN